MNILVNLPAGFFQHAALDAIFSRLGTFGNVRKSSHNSPAEIREDLAWADAVIMWSWPVLTDELLDQAPNIGYIGHIDVTQRGAQAELARQLPISVSRHGFSPAVAEMALALIMNTLRKISNYHAEMRIGAEKWVKDFPRDIDPQERELTGRMVGIIGFGKVGRRLAELLQPFECTLKVVDPFVSESVITFAGAEHVSLHEMLRDSEVVVICAASNDGTTHLLGAEEINLLRQDAVLINVARAALVDTAALIDRLKRGDLFAALDVFDSEPLDPDSELRTLSNACLTPHRAGGIVASVQRTIITLVDDLEAHLEGTPRKHVLTEAMLPSLDI